MPTSYMILYGVAGPDHLRRTHPLWERSILWMSDISSHCHKTDKACRPFSIEFSPWLFDLLRCSDFCGLSSWIGCNGAAPVGKEWHQNMQEYVSNVDGQHMFPTCPRIRKAGSRIRKLCRTVRVTRRSDHFDQGPWDGLTKQQINGMVGTPAVWDFQG